MLKINESEYKDVVNGGHPIVLMFSAAWCGPCRQLYPLIDKLEKTYGDRVNFYKIDTDECFDLCSILKISGIPTLLFIVGSKISGRLIGVQAEKRIVENIEELLI